MAAVTLSMVVGTLKLIGVAPAVYDKLQKWKGKPTKAEREKVISYARRLDERRVFSVSFDREVGGACVGSLAEVKQFTDEVLSEIEHPGLRAPLGGILDSTRWFLDRWGAHPLARMGWEMRFMGPDAEEFFKDLGELRGKVKVLVGMLAWFEPKAVAERLIGGSTGG